jgi:hypothetical protein
MRVDVNGASGRGLRVFVHGDGAFSEADVSQGLVLLYKPRSTTTGNVTPVLPVPLAQFQRDLQSTRASWRIDET